MGHDAVQGYGMPRSKRFPNEVVQRALLWCGRHCCVCGKQCGLHIETHHIDPSGPGNQDNCLPVCYDCHGALSHYDEKQPRGRRFHPDELKRRREQVYENHTRQFVPPTQFELLPDPRNLPVAGFKAMNLGNYPPVQASIVLTTFVDGHDHGKPDCPHYNGDTLVNLNPQHGFRGFVRLPAASAGYRRRLLVRVGITIVDPYGREHRLLPFGYVHMRDPGGGSLGWYYEPAPDSKAVRNGKDGDRSPSAVSANGGQDAR